MTRIIPNPKFLIASVLLVAFLVPLAAQERLLIPYRKGTKWGFCDEKKNVVIPAKYDKLFQDDLPFKYGYAAVKIGTESGQGVGLIDRSGKQILPFSFSHIYVYENVAFVGVRYLNQGIIEIASGGYVVPLGQYKSISEFSEGLARFQTQEDLYGMLNKEGKIVIEPQQAGPSPTVCSEGLIQIYQNGKYGFMDKSRKIVIPCKYAAAESFSEGLAAVKVKTFLDEKYGFVDKTGNLMIKPEYFWVTNFSEGLAVAIPKKDSPCLIINKSGNTVFPLPLSARPTSNFAFHNGLATYYDEEKDASIIIDKKGKVVASFPGVDLSFFSGTIYKASKRGDKTLLNIDCYMNILDGTEYCDD
jgi:hypothetical protein